MRQLKIVKYTIMNIIIKKLVSKSEVIIFASYSALARKSPFSLIIAT